MNISKSYTYTVASTDINANPRILPELFLLSMHWRTRLDIKSPLFLSTAEVELTADSGLGLKNVHTFGEFCTHSCVASMLFSSFFEKRRIHS